LPSLLFLGLCSQNGVFVTRLGLAEWVGLVGFLGTSARGSLDRGSARGECQGRALLGLLPTEESSVPVAATTATITEATITTTIAEATATIATAEAATAKTTTTSTITAVFGNVDAQRAAAHLDAIQLDGLNQRLAIRELDKTHLDISGVRVPHDAHIAHFDGSMLGVFEEHTNIVLGNIGRGSTHKCLEGGVLRHLTSRASRRGRARFTVTVTATTTVATKATAVAAVAAIATEPTAVAAITVATETTPVATVTITIVTAPTTSVVIASTTTAVTATIITTVAAAISSTTAETSTVRITGVLLRRGSSTTTSICT